MTHRNQKVRSRKPNSKMRATDDLSEAMKNIKVMILFKQTQDQLKRSHTLHTIPATRLTPRSKGRFRERCSTHREYYTRLRKVQPKHPSHRDLIGSLTQNFELGNVKGGKGEPKATKGRERSGTKGVSRSPLLDTGDELTETAIT